MRVVVVSAWPPWPPTDGARLVLHHHLRLLAARHELIVLCADARRGSRIEPAVTHGCPAGTDVRTFGPSLPRHLDFVARRARSAVSGEPAHVHWVERPSLLRALAASIRTVRPDVLHLHGWGTAQLWRRAAGVPTVHFAIDAWSLGHGNRDLAGWRRLLSAGDASRVRAHEASHYQRCSRVLVVAPSDATYLAEVAPQARIEVVPNGVEPGPVICPAPSAPVIGFHGAFDADANIVAARQLVGSVLPRVAADIPDVEVLLVGRGAGRRVRELAGPRVTVIGPVPDIRPWLDRVTVYAAPLTTGTGLKNKVLEAMAAGRPVVGTALALAGIGPSDGVVEAGGWPDMADQIVAWLRHRDRASAAGAANRARVEREFTWEASAGRVERAWAEVVQNATRT
jgi:glycosyltransferase involved in cell wall biosynthesis